MVLATRHAQLCKSYGRLKLQKVAYIVTDCLDMSYKLRGAGISLASDGWKGRSFALSHSAKLTTNMRSHKYKRLDQGTRRPVHLRQPVSQDGTGPLHVLRQAAMVQHPYRSL